MLYSVFSKIRLLSSTVQSLESPNSEKNLPGITDDVLIGGWDRTAQGFSFSKRHDLYTHNQRNNEEYLRIITRETWNPDIMFLKDPIPKKLTASKNEFWIVMYIIGSLS